MDTCLVVYNVDSGNYTVFTDEELSRTIEREYSFVRADIDDDLPALIEAHNVKAVVIAGGDGTLRSALDKLPECNLPMFYLPTGTNNEKAKSAKKYKANQHIVTGLAGNNVFTYVCACGSFTPVGYNTKNKYKKRFKLIAYCLRAFVEYKVYDYSLDILADGVDYSGKYTLAMFLKSPRCFIFSFNKLYSPSSEYGQLLLIRSPGKNNFINKVKIFFPLFRAFFIGFKKPYQGKNLCFLSFKQASLHLAEPVPFALDGEKKILMDNVEIRMQTRENLCVCHLKKQ